MSQFVYPPSAALAESERIRTARRLFFEEGTLPSGLVPGAVLRSWQRCWDSGYRSGEAISFDPLQDSAVAALRERSHDLIQASRPEFERLSRVLGEGGYGLLLTDADGHAVAVDGPLHRCGELIRRALRPGVNLAEARIGTSAMSTAMAEGRAVAVFGQEHFFAQHGGFQCAAAPIYGVHGELRGVIDVTRDALLPQFGVLSLLQDSANVIEGALLSAVPARLRVTLRWHDAAPVARGCAMMAFGADGEVVAANQAARRLLDLRSDTAGLHHDDLFQGRFYKLVDLLAHQAHAPWRLRSGLGLYVAVADIGTRPAVLHGQRFSPTPAEAPCLPEFGDEEVARALPKALRAIEAGLPVLILGESGSGKEVAAQALHRHSRLHRGPFVAINCGAIPRELIEGELFGHADGAFTGARRGGARGKLEQAHGGTLFLDEIGDMPLELQTRLLRVLETREVTRLGEASIRKLEFQLLSATHQPLDQLVAQGRFRADLLFRLDGLRLVLPPLRERKQLHRLMTVLLAEEGLRPEDLEVHCFQHLLRLPWPGNCRQLRASLRLARVIAEPGELIGVRHLSAELQQAPVAAMAEAGASPDHVGSLRQHHQTLLAATLQEVQGNVSAAAQRLGVNRSTLHRWMKKAR